MNYRIEVSKAANGAKHEEPGVVAVGTHDIIRMALPAAMRWIGSGDILRVYKQDELVFDYCPNGLPELA